MMDLTGISDSSSLRKGIVQSVLLAAVAMAVIDGIVVSIALPSITRVFSVDVAQSQWIITAYLVTETSLLLLFGRLSEFTGKKTLFLSGLVLFTTASLACGLSATLWELILFRILQACGSAMVFSISAAILFELSSPSGQGRVMGYIGAVTAGAGIAAPIIGGIVTDTLGWEYIFLINVPIGILGLLLFARYAPSIDVSNPGVKMDWPGSALLAISLLFLVLSLVELSSTLAWSSRAFTYLAISLVSFLLFTGAETMSAQPLLDPSIFKNPGFTLPNLAMVCVYMALFMLNLIGPFYFEGVMGFSPSQVGFVFLIAPLIMVIASPLSGWLYDRCTVSFIPVAGIFIAGLSLLLLGYAVTERDLFTLVILFIPLSIGCALFHSTGSTDIMRALPIEKAGLASSVSATLRNLGMTLGVCLSGILLTTELSAAGFSGPVNHAPPLILAEAISTILFFGSALCGIGALLYLVKNILPVIR